jgi:chitinase
MKLVLSYGVPADKLQMGLAAYGRGFAGVEPGNSAEAPGFDQAWTGPSTFAKQGTDGSGSLPYKYVQELLSANGGSYTNYDIKNGDDTIASYIYSSTTKQLLGYESPAEVKSACSYIKATGLQGAILWSMDLDAKEDGTQGTSLISAYRDQCTQ